MNAAGSPLAAPTDAVFGPNGNLYVASFNSGQVLQLDGQTGEYIAVFATGPGSGRVEMLEWGPDDNLYVTTGAANSVLRFDGQTGSPLPGELGKPGSAEFVPAGSGGLADPHALTFGPDGNLYVSSMDDPRVVKFDGKTGAFLEQFVEDDPITPQDESGGLNAPHGLAFGFDGNLYVCSFGSNQVLRYNGTTGAFIDVFATDPSLQQPIQLLFTTDTSDDDGDGANNTVDNCPNLFNADQLDGDQDNIGDVCDNCVATPNPDQNDCDDDGQGDACERFVDCNLNGVLDLCDLLPGFHGVASGQLSPIGGGTPQDFVLESPPESVSDVTVSFTAIADLAQADKKIEVFLNGVSIGEVFDQDANSCPLVPDEDELIIPVNTFNASRVFGNVAVALAPTGSVSSVNCDNQPPFVTVTLSYRTPSLPDCNATGFPDECDIADGRSADCQANAIPDECELASGDSADLNANDIPDECETCSDNSACDIANSCRFAQCVDALCFDQPAAYGDIAGNAGACGPDGTVDLNDILAVLNAFQGEFADGCEFTNINIAGAQGSCKVDNQIDLNDILAVLDAFQGNDHCCTDGAR